MPNTAPTFAFRKGFLQDTFRPGGYEDHGTSVTLQADGRIVVAGWSGHVFGVLRFNADGARDTTFDGDGRVATVFGYPPTNSARGTGVVQQADGRLVVGGYMESAGGDEPGFAVARYNADGSLDTTFSGDGKVTTAVGIGAGIANGIALQADGRIVLAGSAVLGSSQDFAVVRYNVDGSLDTSFDGDGMLTTDFGGSVDVANSVVIRPDGKIVVAGSSRSGGDADFAVVRYNVDGTLDVSFDGDGKLTTDLGSLNDLVTNMVLQPDGKILVAGSALVRYNVDGSLDTTFSGDGKLTTVIGFGRSVTLQADGKILVAGSVTNPQDYYGYGEDFALARYNADGSIDTSFGGGDGVVITDFTAQFSSDRALSVKVQADGRIVVSGEMFFGSTYNVAVARYNADTTFGQAVSNTLDGAPTYTEGGPAVVLDHDVHVQDAELAGQGSYAGATLRLSRNGGASAEDAFSATGALGGLVGGSPLTYSDVTVGTVLTNSGGTLLISFNANATQVRVDGVLRSIAYSNTSDTPPASVRIDWVFSDGNSGGQGTGGPLAATGSTTVTITGTFATTYVWSTLSDGQVISAFDPGDDRLRFDSGISAADVRVDAGAGFVAFSYGGKTVTLTIEQASITTQNVIFDTGSVLVVGDNTTGVTNDAAPNAPQGGSGNDQLIGLGGSDNLSGGNGDDVLVGGADADVLNGGAQFDYASYGSSAAGVVASLSAPAGNAGDAAGDTYLSIEGLIGTAFVDTLVGDNSRNDIQGRGGNDSLYGFGGNDTISGGDGDDYLYGGANGDVLDGGAGFDYARYDGANAGVTVDLLGTFANTGEAAGDSFSGIEGVVGSSFSDFVYGNGDANILQGRDGNDTLSGRDGNDELVGGNGADTLDGGTGVDFARYSLASAGVTASLTAPSSNTGEAAGDVYISIEGLIGSGFRDTLVGDAGANELQGLDGDDSLYGFAGADILKGGIGADYLYGGTGADALDGGADFDYARYDSAAAGVTVDLSGIVANTGEAAGDTFVSIEGVVGSAFGDTIYGNAGANILQGREGNDTLSGRDGNDELLGGNGSDTLNGGTGVDFARYSLAIAGVTASLTAMSSNTGEAAGDVYISIEGLIGTGFRDTLVGDGGANEIQGLDGDDSLDGRTGADVLDGGAGFDYARYDSAAAGVTVDLSGIVANTGEAAGDTFLSIEGVVGSVFGDAIYGDAGANILQGSDGNDTLSGRDGSDELLGGYGADTLDGGAGVDFARYGPAMAGLIAGVTASLSAPSSNTGEAAGDVYISIEGLIGTNFRDTLVGDGGANELQGLDGDDSLYGFAGADIIMGGSGADYLYGGTGADALDGGAGLDYARYDAATVGVTVDLSGIVAHAGEAAGDTFVSVEGVVGSAFGDTIYGNAGANTLQGRDGNDTLIGRDGIDELVGGNGADTLDGGAGADFACYSLAIVGVTASLTSPSSNTGEAAGDVYISIEGLIGSSYRDTLVGDNGANELQGLDGDDSLYGFAGADIIKAGSGADYLYGGTGADALDGGAGFDYARYDAAATGVTVDLGGTGIVVNTGEAAGDSFISIEGVVGSVWSDVLYGDDNANILQGRGGDDIIRGYGGSDDLQGGNGDDTLNGGAGADTLAGEAGNDTFRFTAGEAGGDRVLDFAGNGAAAGDRLIFQGYGTAPQGATFLQIDATRWSINSADGLVHDVITLSNVAPVHVSDYSFI